MIEAKWETLQADTIAPPIQPSDASWSTERPSPYDIPTHVRSFYDSASGVLTIEFRYIAHEELVEFEVPPYFNFLLGKKTRRIFGLRFDVHSFNKDKKKMAEETAKTLQSVPMKDMSTREITLRAIQSKEQKLFAEVA